MHATNNPDCLQWKAFEDAFYNVVMANYTDLLVIAGDMIMPGAVPAAEMMRKALARIPVPMIATMGNNEEGIEDYAKRFPFKTSFVTDEAEIYAMEADRPAPNGKPRMIVGHYPLDESPEEGALYVAGHRHLDKVGGMSQLVRGMDPDKAIGGPAVAIFSVNGGKWTRRDIPLPMFDLAQWTDDDKSAFAACLGVSVKRDPDAMLAELAAAGVRNVEFRWHVTPSAAALDSWKAQTNGHISVHLPDIGLDANIDEIVGFVRQWLSLGASQFTIHVPKVSVKVLAVPENMDKIVDLYAAVIAAAKGAVIGIENMHTKVGEPLEERRFGYIPSEQRQIIELLRKRLPDANIGPLLDIGHARNNLPYSSIYNLSEWYRQFGPELNGMHIHQVETDDTGYHNHNAFRGLFTRLISLSSLLYAWRNGLIRRCPLFIETDEDWKITWQTFQRELLS
ncbi:MAG: hypothetical protein J5833_08315 [Victivallales bacterium]|nr:hypothetical protein [Victivallales bacterium]